jgi:hypothetical protein
MKLWWQQICCLVGFHRWEPDYMSDSLTQVRCSRCGRRKV